MKALLLSVSMLATSATLVFAQAPTDGDGQAEQSTESGRSDGFWEVSVGGGNYMVALSRITSVSRHKYVLDGALIVDEVTIDTEGQSLVRFYFIEPALEKLPGNTGAALSKRATELMERGSDLNPDGLENMVVKKYPETTHAKTIEYRVLKKSQLDTLFGSVRKAWESGRGSNLTIK